MAGTARFVIRDAELRLGIAELRAGIEDKPALLNIAADLMMSSIVRTFRDEGSPAGSWPKLALSTMRNKKYTAGHKLLRMTERLFKSIHPEIEGDRLVIGTNVVYAAVQQFGSADRRGAAIGPQAKLADRATKTGRHQNIPPRPFLVFRPEDPQRIVSGWEKFLAGRSIRIGNVAQLGGQTGGAA